MREMSGSAGMDDAVDEASVAEPYPDSTSTWSSFAASTEFNRGDDATEDVRVAGSTVDDMFEESD